MLFFGVLLSVGVNVLKDVFNLITRQKMGLNEIRNIKLEADIPKPKKQYSIPKKSKKRIAHPDC